MLLDIEKRREERLSRKQVVSWQTIRIWKKTHYNLNLLAAAHGTTQVKMLNYLVSRELEKVSPGASGDDLKQLEEDLRS